MRSNRPQAKICLKSNSNCRLINFFIQIKPPDLLVATIQYEFGHKIWLQNISNLIENGQIQLDLLLNLTFWIKFNHFQLNNRHKKVLFWSLNQKMDKFNWKQINIDQIYIKIAIIYMISSLKSESDQNRRSHSDLEFESTMTIWF